MRHLARAILVMAFSTTLAPLASAQGTAPTTCEPGAEPASHELTRLLDDAISVLRLEPNQASSFEDLEKRLRVDDVVARQAKQAVLLALADQLEAGRVELAPLQRVLTTYMAARKQLSGTFRAALEQIYTTLDPAQRKRFAESFAQQFQAEVQKQLSPEWIDAFATTLKLTDEQKKQLAEMIRNREKSFVGELDRLGRALGSFPSDATAFATSFPQSLDPLFALESALRMVQSTSKISAILTPEQRALAADLLRQRACDPGAEGPAYDYPYSGGFGIFR